MSNYVYGYAVLTSKILSDDQNNADSSNLTNVQ